jgi:hypothetical protein
MDSTFPSSRAITCEFVFLKVSDVRPTCWRQNYVVADRIDTTITAVFRDINYFLF